MAQLNTYTKEDPGAESRDSPKCTEKKYCLKEESYCVGN